MKTLESCSSADIAVLVNDLQGCLPDSDNLDPAKASALGGIVAKVLKLIEDLKAKAWMAVVADVRDLLNEILGEPAGGSISFAQQAAAFKLDWGKLVSVLMKLVPLILGTGQSA